MVTFRPLIAPLFVPANRAERIAKAAASGADAIIVDLEDAVPVQDKEAARQALMPYLENVTVPVILRINPRGTQWFDEDLAFAKSAPLAGVMLPKAETAEDVRLMAETECDLAVIALVETALGLANLQDICSASQLSQIAFGSIDYALDLNCGEHREALCHARSEIVLRSRVADLPAPIDGVTTDLTTPSVLESDCAYAKGLGFGGKLAIHPRQIEWIRAGFAPSQDTLDWAARVVDANAKSRGAAVQVDGKMIDTPVVAKAQRILASVT